MFFDLIARRRSIRRYKDQSVEEEKIERLIEAALRAPSSRDLNPWEFVVVTDREKIVRLAQAKPHGASFLKRAPLAIVVCADPQASDVWVEDASIAAIYLHLAAVELGLGSCWIQIRLRQHDTQLSSEAYVAEVLDLRPGLSVSAIVAIGYPAEEKSPHPRERLPFAKVRRQG
jgi:nitroreductase